MDLDNINFKRHDLILLFIFFINIFLVEDLFTVMEDDLRICSVKPAYDAERRFCFEVLSPTK